MATSLTKEQFLEKAKAVHGDRYSYEKSLKRNMRKPIKIVCPLHGEFEQSPMNHLKTDGCPKCGYLKRSIKQEPEIPVSTKCATCNGEVDLLPRLKPWDSNAYCAIGASK